MKLSTRFFIVSLVLSANVFAFDYAAVPYVGVGGGIQDERISDVSNAVNRPYFASIKIGYGDIRAYAIELAMQYVDNKSNIFSQNDQGRFGLDVTLLKSFVVVQYAFPFIKAGFGAGEMKTDRLFENKIAYSSYNVGFGVFIPIYEHIDVECAYEYRFNSYQSVDLVDRSKRLRSHINQYSLGINYRF